jgi:hypothetical protein
VKVVRTAAPAEFFTEILPERPRDSRRFGSLQILVDPSKANRTTTGDLPQPLADFNSRSHGQSPDWQAILLSFG